MAGRWIAGIGQLLLAVAGFALVIGWFVRVALNTYNLIESDAEPTPAPWLGEVGGVIFGLAWIWALVTSIQILRSVRESGPVNVPPRLS